LIIEAPLPFEVQVRTQLQHIWAQLSESLADRYGFDLKYGGGPPSIAATLAEYSELLAEWDRFITDAGASDADVTETVRGFIERLSTIIRGFGSP
jgi:ppGpp synthetase/RelA/SpoT-type nucleotidyltranferase